MKLKFATKIVLLKLVTIGLILFLSDSSSVILKSVSAKGSQGQGSVTVGWIFSLPWDVSNTLRAPLAGPLSVILAAGLAMIMLFGMVASPLYFLFGSPSRPIYDSRSLYEETIRDILEDILGTSLTIPLQIPRNDVIREEHNDNNTSEEDKNSKNNTISSFPDFLGSAFFLIPEQDEQCRKLMICHAHGFLGYLPETVAKVYQFFSKKIMSVPLEYKNAIMYGLEDQGKCIKTFRNCSKDIVTIAKTTLFNIIPRNLVDLFHLEMVNTQT